MYSSLQRSEEKSSPKNVRKIRINDHHRNALAKAFEGDVEFSLNLPFFFLGDAAASLFLGPVAVYCGNRFA
jgi:hypothetical protein